MKSVSKKDVLENICYTELVYKRINKKLNTQFSKKEIQDYIYKILEETEEKFISKVGKNYYIVSTKNNIRLTINSNTYRIITADKLKS